MKILIDIGHPAHVHYFRNFYNSFSAKGHVFLFIAREREVIMSLLKNYGIENISRGTGKDSSLGKLIYMLKSDFFILRKAIRFKPDLCLSFSSPYLAQVSYLMRIPHISLTDTEHTDKTHKKFTFPFSNVIITPSSYQNDLGPKHVRIKSVIEYFYLHPKFYQPNDSIYDLLDINTNTKYVILRFISWNAFHDVKQHGFTMDQKRELVNILSKKYRVFISSERTIEPEFSNYQISIPPERMHDALAFASLFIGESATMASESVLLGTPAVYVNSLPLMCYLKMEQDYGLLKHFKDGIYVLDHVNSLLNVPDLKEMTVQRRYQMVDTFINPTDFLVWFVENYPDSARVMKENPDYQQRFK